MSRPGSIHRLIFTTVTLACVATVGWGCSAGPNPQSNGGTGGTGGTTTTPSGGTGGTGGETGGTGGFVDDGGVCTSTSAEAERVQLDMIFVIDRSQSMTGTKWIGTKNGLTTFFNDPASAKIGAGLVFFPNNNNAAPCIPEEYQNLDVAIGTLPGNAFALTNAMPADATGGSTPTYGALKGALHVATAYQEAHPKRKTIVVLATDGDPNSCGAVTITDIANLAKAARNYNGVLTYVVAVEGSDIINVNQIAAAGGTVTAYDITSDIDQFTAKIEEIRGAALGCEFVIPPPPNGMDLDPDKVNFSYTPHGVGMPKLLLRADDLVDCGGQPGWYYDNNGIPTKIILCPASCATVQADANAKVDVLFGCKSQIN